MRFKLLRGKFATEGRANKKDRSKSRVYNAGDIIESDFDLAKTFANKFERLPDEPAEIEVEETSTMPGRVSEGQKETEETETEETPIKRSTRGGLDRLATKTTPHKASKKPAWDEDEKE